MDTVDAKTRETAVTLLDVLWTSKAAVGPTKLPTSSPASAGSSSNAGIAGFPGKVNTTGATTIGTRTAPTETTLRHGFDTRGWGNDTIIQPQKRQKKTAPVSANKTIHAFANQHKTVASKRKEPEHDAKKLPKQQQQQQQQQQQLPSSTPVANSGSASIAPAIHFQNQEHLVRRPIPEPQNQMPSKNFPQTSFLGTKSNTPPSTIPLTCTTPMTISMTSVGFGIDHNNTSWVDATEAAVKAVQDAMERSTLRFHTFHSHSLQIKIQLGVPCVRPRVSSQKQQQIMEPMAVDLTRLSTILPRVIPILPIQVEPGGLFVPGDTPGAPSICTVVACIILESQPQSSPSTSKPSTPPNAVLPKESVVVAPPLPPCPPLAMEGSTAAGLPPPKPALAVASVTPPLTSREYNVVGGTKTAGNDVQLQQHSTEQSHNKRKLPVSDQNSKGATKSIEILAMISEREINRRNSSGTSGSSVVARTTPPPGAFPSIAPMNRSSNAGATLPPISMVGNPAIRKPASVRQPQNPSGRQSANLVRSRVGGRNSSYSDYSSELPLPEERDCWAMSTRTTSTPVFPLKLHETLTQIEKDGLDDIIGWLPHGRSFKIHKQKEFTEIILPSAGTTDKGSYYHEKFLRGKKFLSRRMTRQKVNGNRIRSAGNPDEEPDLSMYPICRDDDNNTKHHLAPASNSSAALLATAGATGRAIVSTGDITLSSSTPSQAVIMHAAPSTSDPSVGGTINGRNAPVGTSPSLRVL